MKEQGRWCSLQFRIFLTPLTVQFPTHGALLYTNPVVT